MNKELEALVSLYRHCDCDSDYSKWDQDTEDYNLLKNALERLESVEEENIELKKCIDLVVDIETNNKKLKALEIIKKKGVDVGFIQLLLTENCRGLKEYNDYIGDRKLYLTKTEWSLLKEELVNGSNK